MHKKPRIAAVLAAWMAERKVSANALARATGVPQPTITRILKGQSKDPDTATLQPIASWFNRSLAELRGEAVHDAASNNYSISNVRRNPTGPGIHPARLVFIISWQEAGQERGGTQRVPSESSERYPCPVECSEATFALRVEGVSMEPEFRVGEIVFVDPEAPLAADCYVVARIAGATIPKLKRYLIEAGQAALHSTNPQWPEPIVKVDERVSIIGRVVFKGKRL